METTLSISRTLASPLRGKIDGRRHFGALCAALSGVKPGAIVILDFGGVEDISASWIAAALVPLLPWAAVAEHDIYPVLSGVDGAEKKWLDEIELVAASSGAVFVVRGGAGDRLVGELDPILLQTLRAVRRHGEVTGAGLKRLHPDQQVGASAWNNRLRDLHEKRLLRRFTRGREQVYSVVSEVNLDGSAGTGIADQQLPAADAAGGAGVAVANSV